jgi:hypothetical protein
MFRAEDRLKYKYLPSERVNETPSGPGRKVEKKKNWNTSEEEEHRAKQR